MRRHRTYEVWRGMRRRCSKTRDNAYYGGRGISVCSRWQRYALFVADMGLAPEGKWLDRINNDGNYEPGNCRWVTPTQNQRNSSNARRIAFGGETLCVREWEERLGLSCGSLWHRLKNGWPLEKALTARSLRP